MFHCNSMYLYRSVLNKALGLFIPVVQMAQGVDCSIGGALSRGPGISTITHMA